MCIHYLHILNCASKTNILIQWVWSETWDSAFLMSFQGMPAGLFPDHTLQGPGTIRCLPHLCSFCLPQLPEVGCNFGPHLQDQTLVNHLANKSQNPEDLRGRSWASVWSLSYSTPDIQVDNIGLLLLLRLDNFPRNPSSSFTTLLGLSLSWMHSLFLWDSEIESCSS